MKKRVLIFPCGSEIGLELHRSLSYSIHFEILGGSSEDDHGMFVYENYIGGMPYVTDPDFIEKLNDVVERYNIDFIIPAHDSVVLKLAQEKERLKCAYIGSDRETCEITRSKKETYKQLHGVVPTPAVYEADRLKQENFPVFLKPDVGQGSKGTFKANNADEIDFYLKKDDSLLILEYLPGKEYTIDCFTDRHGNLRFAEARERLRVMNGISVKAEALKDSRFGRLAAQINQRLKFRGPWFFQVKESKSGELVLMEAAARIAGTMGLTRCRGANLPMLGLFDAMGYEVDIFLNPGNLIMDRALGNRYKNDIVYKHVYLDLDDLVIFGGKVNPSVMAFVYQCINQRIAVHLLTRHKLELMETLAKYRLSNVFDEILWVKDPKNEKHAYINEKDAIFIDDSFSERKKVHDHCGIPVFDSHMIESLME